MFNRFRTAVAATADLATILALLLAVYALVNPGTVSRYLDDIADSSARSEVALEGIGNNTGGTERNTRALLGAIPDAATSDIVFITQGSIKRSQVYVSNPSPHDMKGVEMFYSDPQSGNRDRLTTGAFAIPPYQRQEIILLGHIRSLCLQYGVLRDAGVQRIADQRSYRANGTEAPDPAGYIDTYPGILTDFQRGEGRCDT